MSDGVMAGVKVVFFDVDDTLYPAATGLGQKLTSNIERYLVTKLGVAADVAASARANYQKHGTCLAGLVAEMPPDFSIDSYISDVYGDVDYKKYIKPSPKLKMMLEEVAKTRRVWAFSNAHKEHVLDVLAALELPASLFEGIVEARGMNWILKPKHAAFDTALRACGDCDRRQALLIDDNFNNIDAARDYGMQAVHISNSEDAFCSSTGCAEHQSRTASPRNSKVAQSCMCNTLELKVAYPDLLNVSTH